MQFAHPLWLIVGVIVCATLLWLYRRLDRSQRSALTQFAAERLLGKLTSSVSMPRRRIKRALFTLGVGLLFVALARPQAGFEWQETHRKGLELLFAVDTSKSMLAQDMKPDRLTRAKLAVTDLIERLQGDGVGLVAFAGNAFLQCPVTLDYDAFRESLDALDTRTIPHGGSNIAAAIREAGAVFQKRDPAQKILILITDGEDLGGEGVEAAKAAEKNGVKIFTVGVGGTAGELVPVPRQNGGTDFARDENGQFVKSHLDETTLKKIAEATGGMYQPLGTHGEGLTKIYEQGLEAFTRQDLSSRRTKVPLEQFHWALLAALACFVGEWLIGNRRASSSPKAAPAPQNARRPSGVRFAATALAILLAGVGATRAATPQSAEQAYQSGDYATAQQEYAAVAEKRPSQAELQFNTGAAAYKAGDYDGATAALQESLKNASVPLQHRAYYNLGNTQYRSGQKTEKTKPEETIKIWENAVKSYSAALQIAANDTAAKHNRDLVQRKIDELKKQQEQKKQEQEKKDQKNQPQEQSQQEQNPQHQGQKDQGQQEKNQKDHGQQNQTQKDKDTTQSNSENDANAKKDGNEEQKQDSGRRKSTSDVQKQAANDNQNADQNHKDEAGGGSDNAENQQNAQSKSKAVNAENKPSKGEIETSHGEQPMDTPTAATGERRLPGEMTPEEARQLLDALKGDERKAPAISAQGLAGSNPDENTFKDW